MSYSIELYRLDVVNSTFDKIAVIDTYQDLSFMNKLNGVGAAQFSLNMYDPVAIPENLIRYRTKVLIKKNTTPVWVGMITKVSGNLQGVNGSITVQCLSYFENLMHRYTGEYEEYVNTPGSTIATTLITNTQAETNGELLISNGNIETTNNTNDTLEYKSIGRAIIDQSDNINGYDFTMTPTVDANNDLNGVNINIYGTAGSDRGDLPKLQLGRNVNKVSFSTQGNIVNTVTGLGFGTGSNVISSTASSSSSQISFTRLEDVKKYPSIQVESTLQDRVDEYLRINQGEQYYLGIELMPNTSPVFGSYSLGDVLYFDLKETNGNGDNTYINFTGTGRVLSINVEVDSEGTEFVTPKVEYYS